MKNGSAFENALFSIWAYLFPFARVKYLISSQNNLNFGIILPWLEKILNLAPLKCPEILPNRLDMWKLSD